MPRHSRATIAGVFYRTIWFDPGRAVYRYDVRRDRDIRDLGGDTSVLFDADTGALRAVWAPTGSASGDTIRTWITSLHMAALWGWPFKLFVCLMGLAVVLLSGTGAYIWWRKREAKRHSAAGSSVVQNASHM